LRAEKLVRKARQAQLWPPAQRPRHPLAKREVARQLLALAAYAQSRHWSAEGIVRNEARRLERQLRREERRRAR
jgi:hypothetical protein